MVRYAYNQQIYPITVKVVASPDEPYALLGRDVLNKHTIVLDGPNLILEVR
jgi:hypothetical protein